MVVKMMRWRPWSRKYEVRLTVHRLDFEGGAWLHEGAGKGNGGLAVEIRWKGPKVISLGSLRRTVKRNCTREEGVKKVANDGVLVEWDEEFHSVCSLSGYRGNVFHPWEISFTVLMHDLKQDIRNKLSIVGSAALNLAEYVSKQVIEAKIPLTVSSAMVDCPPSLYISVALLEFRGVHQSTEMVQSPIMHAPSPSETSSTEKDLVSVLKSGHRKVKMSNKKSLNEEDSSEGIDSSKGDDNESTYPFDLVSPPGNEFEEGERDEGNSVSYGTLAYANYAGFLFYSSAIISNEDEDLIYYSNCHRLYDKCSLLEDPNMTVSDQSLMLNSRRSILPWRKRKLSFKSPKVKGEPLLKKTNGEEGGDDIDFDRRQLSSDESLFSSLHKSDEDSNANRSPISEFGDDNFTIGRWEEKEITSRDGHMKIKTDIFFASLDQRSDKAAGESACTALVAVIADWLHNNENLMPIKSQFDSLIRDGSLEWRNLCDNQIYGDQFPDKHFDLETVLDAKIRGLCAVPEKSFIGFFHPDGMTEESGFEFLRDSMSFDDIWDEISRLESGGKSPVFIVSWNDHFFVLKVEVDAYYIIDTLGERLHEGCSQAYILKFDKNTTIRNAPTISLEESSIKDEEIDVYGGKETCKEYIKSFLAAIPIRELREDIKKGLKTAIPLHHRLQIELHLTELLV